MCKCSSHHFTLLTMIFNLLDSCEDYVEIDTVSSGYTIMCNKTTDNSWGEQHIATGGYTLIFRTNLNEQRWLVGKGFQIYSLCFQNECKAFY